MNILTRYTLKQIWIPALMASVVISFVVMLATIGEEIQKLLRELPIAQLTFMDISRISLYSLPSLTGMILPVTFLLGIMLTFGRMAQTSELTAAKAAGIPLSRLVLPVVAMGAAVSAACFLLLDQGQPWAYQRLSQLGVELPLRITLDAVPTGEMHAYGDWRVYIGERDEDKKLHNVIVLQDTDNGIRAFYARTAEVAKKGDVSSIELKDVQQIEEHTAISNIVSMSLALPAISPLSLGDQREGWPLSRMLQEEKVLAGEFEETGNIQIFKELAKLRRAIAERLSFPLMCLAVSIVAAPIGARAKRSGRSSTFASGLIIIAAYFILRSILKDIPPGPLAMQIGVAQIPNLVLMAVGLGFIWRVDRI